MTVGTLERCSECRSQFPNDELVQIKNTLVCGACKPLLMQRIEEGGRIDTDFMVAGFGARFGAKFIDNIILQIIAFIGVFASAGGDFAAAGSFSVVSILLSWIFPVLYTTFFLGKFGSTPGKMALGIKVISMDGEDISYGRAFGRHFAEIISGIILCIGYIMAAFDKEYGQALHDRICKTRVIKK